ncbi:pilus assembly protein N-terminal domain-containing protein [Myxococcota bacterium]|nr:pilus assembly protein N-terminal domain-containing protein [Myxococcota bacterium]
MMRFDSLFTGATLAAFVLPAVAAAQDDQADGTVQVSLGGSTVINPGGITRATLTDPSIAEVQPAGNGVLIIGRRVGETNLILFGSSGQTTMLVKVTLPARAVQSELGKAFGKEDIEARAVGGAIVLVGAVSSGAILEQAEELVLGFLSSPSFAQLGVVPKVINLLRVKQKQQVQLEVKFAEVTRSSLRQMGTDLSATMDSGRAAFGYGVAPTPGAAAQSVADKAGAPTFFVGKADGKFPFAAALSLLNTKNLSRTLAEPTLVAASGQTAKFLAGGEVPIVIQGTALSQPQVDYKPVGVYLTFMPNVLDDDTIELQAHTGVSAVDESNSNLGFVGFKTRSSSTTIRLRDGQSFAIAGVLSDEIENELKHMPGLGQIPIIGTLFSSKEFRRRESELVIVVTAHLTEPMDPGQMPPLPGEDRVNDPSDVELFLLNITDPDAPVARGGGPGRSPAVDSGDDGALAPRRTPAGVVGFWR